MSNCERNEQVLMLFEHVLIKIYFLTKSRGGTKSPVEGQKVPWRDTKSRGGQIRSRSPSQQNEPKPMLVQSQ